MKALVGNKIVSEKEFAQAEQIYEKCPYQLRGSRKEPFGKRPGGCFSHQRLCEESVGERRGLRQRRPAVGKRHPEP